MWCIISFSYNKHKSVLGRQGKNHPSIAWCSQNTAMKQWNKRKIKHSGLGGVHLMALLVLYWSHLGGHPAPYALWHLLDGFPPWALMPLVSSLISLQNYRSRWGCIFAASAGRPTVLPDNGVIGPCLGDTVSISLGVMLESLKMLAGPHHHSHPLSCIIFLLALKQILPQLCWLKMGM